jgi:predicted PurR-regulated permease PerM
VAEAKSGLHRTPPEDARVKRELYRPRTRAWALVAVLLLSLVGAAIVAEPLAIALILGGVMAVSVQGLYRTLSERLGRRPTLAATVVTLGCGLVVTVAGTSILVTLTNELVRMVALFHDYSRQFGSDGTPALFPTLSRGLERVGIDPAHVTAWTENRLADAASFAASSVAVVLRTTSQALLDLIVALLTMYYVLREGSNLEQRIERLAPLEPRHTRALIHEAREVGRTAFLGTIATAVVQGSIAGLGYAVLDVPHPVTWAVATALASFIPVAGTLIVWVPVSGYLFVTGHAVRAVLLAIWGVAAVTMLADYVIRPRIVGRHGHSHPLLTLIALLGGIEVFGLGGLVIAPIIMSIFVAALRLYERELSQPKA